MTTSGGFTVWLTGLSGAGKSTIAHRLADTLRGRGVERVEILDGDEVREHLSAGLGFSRADRDTNIRRIAYVCRLLTRNGVATIVAAISPYRGARAEARRLAGEFVEVFVDAPLAVAEARDPKGLYRKARAGVIPAFTGVSDPYEPPEAPDVHCPTDRQTPDESVAAIVDGLERRGLVPPEDRLCTPEEEARILERLGELGYLEAGRS
jgi:adenylyl-sulfate kinase